MPGKRDWIKVFYMGIGATISDLHLFSHHSRPERYFDRIDQAAQQAEVFILNGDIFDFKCSHHGVFSSSVVAAVHFIEALLDKHPDCRFHIILGNHDAVPPYMEALEDLATTHPNLEWHEFACVVDNRVFLHGDAIHAGSSNEAIRRFRSKLRRPANGHVLQRMAHSAVHRSHVPWIAFKVFPKRILASRLLAYLRHENWLNGGGIEHVYFGHTHLAFEDFRYRGYTFHNCGSATHGARLRVVRFPLLDRTP
ncbi:MAG TPA: metallophosphoesterase [Oceanipulchritudo sp.]|nr:metallophosphoesterase [Oceanipulchritudo sp.]